MGSLRIRTHQLQAAAAQHQASCMLCSSLGLHVASSSTYVLPITLQKNRESAEYSQNKKKEKIGLQINNNND
jgi:hypothetical protein